MMPPNAEDESIPAAIEKVLREAGITPISIGGGRQAITPKIGPALGALLLPGIGTVVGAAVRAALDAAGAAVGAGYADQHHKNSLQEAAGEVDLVVADISQLDPNEMYVLGAADAAGKLSIVLVREGSQARLPAVLAGKYVIVYRPGETDHLAREIRRCIDALGDS